MRLKELNLEDKNLFYKFLNLNVHGLSVYTFTNIYIWKGIFDIYWTIIRDSLCVFFKDKIGCFMYMPPLAKTLNPYVVEESFRIMDSFNKNRDISRIENIEAKDVAFYQNMGYECHDKYAEYLYRRTELAQLKGNKFKSQRACYNYFIKHNNFGYLPFSLRYRNDCFMLYRLWMSQRKTKSQDPLYIGMLGDSLSCLEMLLDNYRDLDCTGRIVKIGREIKAFTFGFKLNNDTFCILYEITDLSLKGLAQFIFRQFCGELKDYKYINIMDDSGLENLKRVKLSYHPIKSIPAYIVTRKDG